MNNKLVGNYGFASGPAWDYHGYEFGLTRGNLLHDIAGEEAAWVATLMRPAGRTTGPAIISHKEPALTRFAAIGHRQTTVVGSQTINWQLHVRRPRLDYDSHAVGLDRNEVGALLVAAGLGAPAEHALISLLARTACACRRQ